MSKAGRFIMRITVMHCNFGRLMMIILRIADLLASRYNTVWSNLITC